MTSVMIWAQTPRADLEGAQLGAAAQHLQQGKTEQTIRECKGVLATDPRSAPAHMLLALAYIAKGSVDMVADAKAELSRRSISIRSWCGRASTWPGFISIRD
jgi:Tfp pilus assembly protein PilF